jgi:hypothetical protein
MEGSVVASVNELEWVARKTSQIFQDGRNKLKEAMCNA